ncbi:hypothetical protein HY480_04765 [Candidatus Uhrbacteria bacterium]|nr:hypothetical protein [Candidatus Uhrbacteria bacterium]
MISSPRTRDRTQRRTARRVSRSEFNGVRRDVRTLRSLLISFVGEDREGAYRPMFVREILTASTERPTRRFRSAAAFLAEISSL